MQGGPESLDRHGERPPGLVRPRWRSLLPAALVLLGAVVVLYLVVPAIAGLEETWRRISHGHPGWLLAALAFEILSYASYMALVRAVFDTRTTRIDWVTGYRITMAGVVASRLFALAGTGGIVVTAWALRRIGMPGREVAARMAAFFALLYGVYMTAMVLAGLGLWTGTLPGHAPAALALGAAALGAAVVVAVLAIAFLSGDLEAVRDRAAGGRAAIASVPATVSSGVRTAFVLLRSPRPGLLGAPGWFAFDIAVLWACLEAFGASPPAAVIVLAYFVGMAANALPIPGGIGVVEGGMAGALIACGVEAGPAFVAVLSYRAFAFWLPMIPGLFAYLGLLSETEGSRADARDSAGPPPPAAGG